MMQEIKLNLTSDRSDDDENEGDTISEPPNERWPPLGAASTTNYVDDNDNDRVEKSPRSIWSEVRSSSSAVDPERMKEMEEEQEQLNSSLLALTGHFAQVQFRLQQIVKASSDEKEVLLKELEEFAFRGCPDMGEVKKIQRQRSSNEGDDLTTPEHEELMQKQRSKQVQLIGQLKDQLEDLERFAYLTGDSGLPSSEIMAKQQVILDHLRERMNLDLEQFDKLTPQELQYHVDEALKQLIKPMKVKDQIMEQLRTQVTDLERYIEFLQADAASSNGSGGATGGGGGALALGNRGVCFCNEAKNMSTGSKRTITCPMHGGGAMEALSKQKSFGFNREDKSNPHGALSSTTAFLQLYILAYLGCHGRKFQKNQLKRTTIGNHWGDLRAALEVAVKSTVEAVEQYKTDETPATLNTTRTSQQGEEEEEAEDVFRTCPEEVVAAVRKQLCPALRDLLQHGLLNPNHASSSMAGLGCFPTRSPKVQTDQNVHAWDVIVKYYDMKHGKEFSEAPVRKLSQSFNLDSIGGKAITSKQILLSTIDHVIVTHTKLKRSQDAMFKAFVCAALNHKKLVAWLRMILRTKEIVDECYAPWSYVARTGFDDACGAMEKFNKYSFCLPYDLAVRQFNNMRDAF